MNALLRNRTPFLILLVLAGMLFLAVVAIATQPTPIDPLDPPAITPTPAPSDWTTVGRTVRHTVVAPVSPKKAPVHQIALPKPPQPELVKATPDGGCLAIQTVPAVETGVGSGSNGGGGGSNGVGSGGGSSADGTGQPVIRLRMIRYRADGSVLWDQTDAEPIAGFPLTVCVFPDGGFATGLHVQTRTAPGGDVRISGRLIRFAANGTRLWAAEPGQAPAGALDHLFPLADGSLITVGLAEVMPDAASTGPAAPGGPAGTVLAQAILAQRFAAEGQRLQQHTLSATETAGASFPMLSDASYTEGAGLVIAWQTVPIGPAATGSLDGRVSHLTVLDDSLAEVRSLPVTAGTFIGQVQALPDSLGILAFGTETAGTPSSQGTTPGSTPGSTPSGGDAPARPATLQSIVHYSVQGSLDWRYAASDSGTWLPAATRTVDGHFVVGQYRVKSDGSESTSLYAFVAQEPNRRNLAEIPGRIEQLVPGAGGGFTAVLRQTVRTLPQPPQVSMLWTDTEAIVCQFNRRLQLEWRRTIDQYKYQMRNDLVVVTSQDRLLVG